MVKLAQWRRRVEAFGTAAINVRYVAFTCVGNMTLRGVWLQLPPHEPRCDVHGGVEHVCQSVTHRMTHFWFIKLDFYRSDPLKSTRYESFPSSIHPLRVGLPLRVLLPLPPPPPPALSPLFLLHLSSSSSHFPGAAAAASVSSVRPSAAMVDSPCAMNKVSTVPEIKPLNQYDFSRAKISASVRWLLSKSYGSAGTSVREAAWVGRLIIIIIIMIKPVKGLNPGLTEAAQSIRMQRPSRLQPQGCLEVVADAEPVIVTMSWMLVGGDLCAAGCVMRARVADSVIAAAQQSLCQGFRPGGGSRCKPGLSVWRRCWRGCKWVKPSP